MSGMAVAGALAVVDPTNPEQLFAAGYAACFHNGLRLIGRDQGVTIDDSTVQATVSLLTREEAGFILAVKLSAHLPVLDQATADKLLEATHRVCPYSNSTRGNIDVTLEATI